MSQRLYKAKADHNGEWVAGYYLEVAGVPFILPEGKPLNDIVQVRPETVRQSSGKKDKRGVEIFEFDFIKDENGDEYLVVYNDFHCAFILNGLTPCVMTQSFRMDEVDPECVEVIGSIYDEEGDIV